MGKKFKQYNNEFKDQIINEILEGQKSKAEICREYGLSSSTIWEWEQKYEKGTLYKTTSHLPETEALFKRIAELERKVGQQTLEIDFLKKAKRVSEELRRGASSRSAINGISHWGAKS